MISGLRHFRQTQISLSVAFRFSTIPDAPSPQLDLLSFFNIALHQQKGPTHSWFNQLDHTKLPLRRDTTYLVLAGVFHQDSSPHHVHMIEKLKYFQRRYPQLHVFGFQGHASFAAVSSQTHILQTIIKEYITFPILLSNNNFPEMRNGPYYLVFKDFDNPMLYYEKGTEIGTIRKAIEDHDSLCHDKSKAVEGLKGHATKQLDVIKEPCVSMFQNSLLSSPGCISGDEDGNRLFLSDSNHHRIIIFNNEGKIIDCIGSSPGFEDGNFESAKLLRPAALLYDDVDDCLYVVDSENHAIRRADMGRRTLETIYPPCDTGSKFIRLWSWVSDKLGIGREVAPSSEDFDLEPITTPWHLMKSRENNLLVANRSFHTLWIVDPTSGKVEEVVTGYPKVLEVCGEIIMERLSSLKQISGEVIKQNAGDTANHSADCSLKEGTPAVSLTSSFTILDDDIIYSNAVGQAVLKLNRHSGAISNLHFSNFGVLGLPYWFNLSLEKVFAGVNSCQRLCLDHLQCFTVLPGRCDIQVNIDIPVDTVLAGPLQEGCVWRQARGSAAEVSGDDGIDTSTEKVGVAQQWFDELDNLAFSGAAGPEQASAADDDSINSSTKFEQENRVHIQSAINISPGTSEVIIYAVLYLKMKMKSISNEKHRKEIVERILRIADPKAESLKTDPSVETMIESSTDLGEFVFMKPLHLRLEFDCLDHPKADKANDVVLTDSTVEVNVSLT